MPGMPPVWFTEWVQSQQSLAAAALEAEHLRVADEKKQAEEARLRMIHNEGKPGKALPTLLEFYGDADKLDSWLQQARAKIEVDYYGCTEYVKFWALNGSLRGKALRRMDAWVREYGTPELANGHAFLQRVEFVFRDPQAKERAQRKLDAFRQGSKPFLEVFTEWQSLLLEAGGGSWPDDAKKVSLDRILSDELVRAMITVPSQPDFESYCSILKETDDKLRAYKARTTRRDFQGASRTSNNQVNDTPRQVTVPSKQQMTRKASVESMDWEPSSAKAATTSAKRAKWVTKEELDDRRRTRRCFRCGASSHQVRECPYGPAQRPVTIDAVHKRAARLKEVEPELEDEEASSEDSEN